MLTSRKNLLFLDIKKIYIYIYIYIFRVTESRQTSHLNRVIQEDDPIKEVRLCHWGLLQRGVGHIPLRSVFRRNFG